MVERSWRGPSDRKRPTGQLIFNAVFAITNRTARLSHADKSIAVESERRASVRQRQLRRRSGLSQGLRGSRAQLCLCHTPGVEPNNDGLWRRREVLSAVGTPLPETSENPPTTLILLTDRGGVCNGIQTGTWGKNITEMAIYLFSERHSSPPASPGTYHLRTTDPMTGVAYFVKQDEQCRLAPGLSNSVPADSGSVVLESINPRSGGSAKGSFDIILQSGDRVTGTFDSAYCAPPSSSRTRTCG